MTQSAPTEEFPPGYLDKAAAWQAAAPGAAADPLPGPLVDAFLPESVVVAGLTLRPLHLTDVAILKRLEHPILKEIAEALKPAEERRPIPYQIEDALELLFAWSRPLPEVRAILAEGRQAFRERAMVETGDKLPLAAVSDYAVIMEALAAHFCKQYATALSYRPKSAGDGPGFPSPPASGHPTASAGG